MRVCNPPRLYTFYVSRAFIVKDPSADMPHIGGAVVDAAEAGEGEVLRSEVVAAIDLLKLQFRSEHFCRHHTLPVSSVDLETACFPVFMIQELG